MPNKKYQIFVSSTYLDLIDERSKVIETILREYHIPIGMEMFSAGDEEQWEIIKETIDDCDYYLLIIGHRYGSLTDGISYTEKEYDYAKSMDIPILAFIKDRNASTKPEQRENDPEIIKKLDKFINKVSGKMREMWINKDDLAGKVSTALHKTFKRNPRIGWIKADKGISQEVSEELVRLSKENRAMREQLKKLNDLKPKIEVLLNGKKELNLEYMLFVPERKLFQQLNVNEIPDDLKSYVSEEDIDEYNRLLISKKIEVDQYEREVYKYWRMKCAPDTLMIEIENTGNIKANDLFIDLEFPEGLAIIDNERISELIIPDEVKGLETPILKAQNKIREAQKKQLFSGMNMSSSINGSINEPFALNFPKIEPINLPWNEVKDNQLQIKLIGLLHHRKYTIEKGLWLAPLDTGNFEIKVKIMCEEFNKPEEHVIPVNIIASNNNMFNQNGFQKKFKNA